MKQAPSRLTHSVAGVLGKALVGSLFTTVRVERSGQEHLSEFRKEKRPVIFVFWHGHLLPLVYAHRHQGAVVLVSEHRDGEYIARIIERYGFETVSRLEHTRSRAGAEGAHPSSPTWAGPGRYSGWPPWTESNSETRSACCGAFDGAAAHPGRSQRHLLLDGEQLGPLHGAQAVLDRQYRVWTSMFHPSGSGSG